MGKGRGVRSDLSGRRALIASRCRKTLSPPSGHHISVRDFRGTLDDARRDEQSKPKADQNSLVIFHLIPQLHNLHLDPSLALVLQDSLVRLPMLRRPRDTIEVIRVILLLTERRAGRSLADLQVRRVFGNVSVCPASISTELARRGATHDPRAVERPIPLYGMACDCPRCEVERECDEREVR